MCITWQLQACSLSCHPFIENVESPEVSFKFFVQFFKFKFDRHFGTNLSRFSIKHIAHLLNCLREKKEISM